MNDRERAEPLLKDLREVFAKHGVSLETITESWSDQPTFLLRWSDGFEIGLVDVYSWIHRPQKRVADLSHILEGTKS